MIVVANVQRSAACESGTGPLQPLNHFGIDGQPCRSEILAKHTGLLKIVRPSPGPLDRHPGAWI